MQTSKWATVVNIKAELYAKISLMLKLLIVKTSSLGDVIHNLPIIHDLLQHYPEAEIDWVVEDSFADIPKSHPAVQRVIPVAIRRWRKTLFSKATWSEINAAKQSIQQKQYDIILDTQGLLKSSLLAHLGHGSKHGYNKLSAREPLASFLYNTTHQVSKSQHAVARNRTLTALALGYPIPLDRPNYGIKGGTATNLTFNKPYIIGLHGTSRDSKLWPTDCWIALGQALANQGFNLALPWATNAELERAKLIAGALKNTSVLPKLTIAQLISVISNASTAIGVDTGLSHLAVALNIPTIAIYTDTNPSLTGVYAGASTPAINLGNIHQSPHVNDVLQAFSQLSKK